MSTSASLGKPFDLSPSATLSAYLKAWMEYALRFLPGLALLVVIAATARVIGRGGLDSYCLVYAIVLGILIRNTVGLHALFEVGTRTYEVFWKVGIVLLGSQMGLGSFSEVGIKGVALAAIEVVGTISVTLWLTRVFKIDGALRQLLAIGMAICGVSAIIALSSTLRSDEEDTSYAVSVILCFGLLSLAVMPFLGRLMNLSPLHFGLWAGLAVNNTAESRGNWLYLLRGRRSLRHNRQALPYTISRRGPALLRTRDGSREVGRHAHVYSTWLGETLPKVCTWTDRIFRAGHVPVLVEGALDNLNHLYRWAFLLGFAGVGLRTSLSRLRTRGVRPLALALGVQTITAGIMLACVRMFF